jgi:hypothetical protein
MLDDHKNSLEKSRFVRLLFPLIRKTGAGLCRKRKFASSFTGIPAFHLKNPSKSGRGLKIPF